MAILLLHTYRERTKNAGDWLIQSTLRNNLLAVTDEEIDIAFVCDVITEKIQAKPYRKILITALSIFDDVYPNFIPLNNDIDSIDIPIVPIGCTWQNVPGYPEQAIRQKLNDNTRRFFARLIRDGGPIAVRDHQAMMVLQFNELAARFVGDCGLYDPESIGNNMRRPTQIRSVVFTTPHGKMFRHQAVAVLDYISRAFPDADRVISLQSLPGTYDKFLEREAHDRGFRTLSVYDNPSIIESYDQFDLHVGYRLHGHIGFLRKRIPSVLLIEDARGEGFKASFPVGCFSARSCSVDPELAAYTPQKAWQKFMSPNESMVVLVEHFLNHELETQFRRSASTGGLIDACYHEAFMPILKELVVE